MDEKNQAQGTHLNNSPDILDIKEAAAAMSPYAKVGSFDSKESNAHTSALRPLFIGVTGGTAGGKTSLCKRISVRFEGNIAIISLDSFYRGLS